MAGSAADIDTCLQTAIAAANSGRRGPAVLLIPADLLGASVPSGKSIIDDVEAATAADLDAVAQAADVLEAAQQPLILTGAGGWWSNAGNALRRLAALGFPVTGNGLGRGLVAEDWQSGFSWPLAQIAARQADAVLVAGSRLTQRQGFGLPPRFAAHARFVQIDVDERERHRSRPADIFIAADAATTLDALADLLERRGIRARNPGWLGKALAPRMQRLREVLDRRGDVIHPLQLGAAIAGRLPVNSILVGDGADIQSWMYGVIAVRQAPGFMDHYPMGAMGSGTPLAVGTATAVRDGLAGDPGGTTVLITGDGALGFHAAELHAAARAGLRLLVIVGNDGAWGTEVHEQRRAIGRALNTELGQLPYERLAEAFGCKGLQVSAPGQLEATLDEAFACEGPVLVNVLIDREAGAELASDPLLRMIVFSDLAQGRRELGVDD